MHLSKALAAKLAAAVLVVDEVWDMSQWTTKIF